MFKKRIKRLIASRFMLFFVVLLFIWGLEYKYVQSKAVLLILFIFEKKNKNLKNFYTHNILFSVISKTRHHTVYNKLFVVVKWNIILTSICDHIYLRVKNVPTKDIHFMRSNKNINKYVIKIIIKKWHQRHCNALNIIKKRFLSFNFR